MAEHTLAMEVIPAIRRLLEALDGDPDAKVSGIRAALWRAQQHAAHPTHTLEDLRRYCLESLAPHRVLDQEEQMRGYREGFQAVLREIRRLERQRSRA